MVPWRKGTLQIRRSGETPPSGRQWKEAFSFTLKTKKQVHRALYISKGKKKLAWQQGEFDQGNHQKQLRKELIRMVQSRTKEVYLL